MKWMIAAAPFISASLVAFSPMAYAQDGAITPDHGNYQKSEAVSLAQARTSPEFLTSFVAYFIDSLEYNLSEGKAFPTVLVLAQPLMISEDIVIPENSLVNVTIVPDEGGARIVAHSILVNGVTLPINAVSALIPSESVTFESQNLPGGGVSTYSRAGGATGCVISGLFSGGCSGRAMSTGASAGALIGLASGANTPRAETIEFIRFQQSSLYILTFE